MTAPKRANDSNLPPHWKIRLCMVGGGIIHVISISEPSVDQKDGRVFGVNMDPITGTEHGDTIGFMDWTQVAACTWRFAPLATAE